MWSFLKRFQKPSLDMPQAKQQVLDRCASLFEILPWYASFCLAGGYTLRWPEDMPLPEREHLFNSLERRHGEMAQHAQHIRQALTTYHRLTPEPTPAQDAHHITTLANMLRQSRCMEGMGVPAVLIEDEDHLVCLLHG